MLEIASKREKLFEQLTEQQREAIYLIVEREEYSKGDPEFKSYEDIAEEVGATRKTVYSWRTRNQVFQEALAEASRERLAALAPQAFGAMSKLIQGRQPSTKALDLLFKSLGWVKNEQSIDLTTRTRDDKELEAEIERLTNEQERSQ